MGNEKDRAYIMKCNTKSCKHYEDGYTDEYVDNCKHPFPKVIDCVKAYYKELKKDK